MFFKLRSRPWIHQVDIGAQDLYFAGPRETFEFVSDKIASGASGLRGAIFRDLLLNMNDYPVDFIGDVKDLQMQAAASHSLYCRRG